MRRTHMAIGGIILILAITLVFQPEARGRPQQHEEHAPSFVYGKHKLVCPEDVESRTDSFAFHEKYPPQYDEILPVRETLESGRAVIDNGPVLHVAEMDHDRSAVPRLRWELLEDFPPGGIEDPGYGILDHYLVLTGGFCGGMPDMFDNLYNCTPRGFREHTYMFDLRTLEWHRGPDLPGGGRQGIACGSTLLRGLVCAGGYSYEPLSQTIIQANTKITNTAKLGARTTGVMYALSYNGARYVWDSFGIAPYPVAGSNLLSQDDRFAFLVGGCLYTGKEILCRGDGRSVARYDVATGQDVHFAEIPGSSRMSHASVVARGRLYIFGGIGGGASFGGPSRYHSVVDNWVLDIATKRWEELPSSPWQCVNYYSGFLFRSRYIVLSGGASYGVARYNGSAIFPLTDAATCHTQLEPNILTSVYTDLILWDLEDEVFINTPHFRKPVSLNAPIVVHDDVIYLAGGEGTAGRNATFIHGQEYSGRHSRIVMRGTPAIDTGCR